MKFWHVCSFILTLIAIAFIISIFVGSNDQQGGLFVALMFSAIGTAVVWGFEELF